MGRRQTDSEVSRFALLILFLLGAISCYMVYLCFSVAYKSSTGTVSLGSSFNERSSKDRDEGKKCCKGVEHMELWGNAVKWGSNFKVNSSEQCCMACKDMCLLDDGPCLCDSWVFCGDRQACGPRFGECWLKKQIDTLDPERRDSGDQVIWTSGLIFANQGGVVGFRTEYGIIRIKLLSDCAPLSVAYILELLALRHCAGCQIYRAESRGSHWDSKGNHVEHAPFGPPYALIQGTLEAHETLFKEIPAEGASRTIRRGSVAWVGSGPEFFISLANHHEWKKPYTVFGFVLSQDMEVVERIAQLPTKPDVWRNINVSVLENHVPIRIQRLTTSASLALNTDTDTHLS